MTENIQRAKVEEVQGGREEKEGGVGSRNRRGRKESRAATIRLGNESRCKTCGPENGRGWGSLERSLIIGEDQTFHLDPYIGERWR